MTSDNGEKEVFIDNPYCLRPRYPLFQEIFLTIMTLLTIPMYSMAICLAIYVGMMYAAPNLWIRTVLLLYIPFILLDRTPSRGIRWHVNFWRSMPIFRWVARYFDMELVKTATLDQKQKFMFLYHPHGVICMGLNLGINTNGCGFQELFPGISTAPVTLNESFYAPLFREWMLLLGFVGADKRTLEYQLQQRRSIVLVPGGAMEALHAHPHVMKLYLKKRKGFVRLALETRTPLVPIIGFGENNLFDTVYDKKASSHSSDEPHSWLWRLQQKLVKVLKFSTPLLTHLIPRPAKMTLVVGAPLELPKNTTVRNDQDDETRYAYDETLVDTYHIQYLQHVKRLYEAHKCQYGHEHVDLQFL